MAETNILRHLNPADYFTLAMDQEIRNEGMPGSLCGFALQLEQQPDIKQLQLRIDEFIDLFPSSLASLQQQGKRYYWKKRAQSNAVFFHHICPDHHDSKLFQDQCIEQIFNERSSREDIDPLQFHLISAPDQHCFLIRWIHPFCDARGADLILKYLCTDQPEQRLLFDHPKSDALVLLQLNKYNWYQKIALFLKAKQHIKHIDRLQSILPVVQQPIQTPQKLLFQVHRFSGDETEAILKNARRYAGITGTSLYYIGCLMRALERINPASQGEAYCVPYAFNLRKQKALSPMLGNHVCALFAQAPRTIIADKQQLFEFLKQQNRDSIKQQLDYAFLPLMWAGSWLSMDKYGKTLRLSSQSGKDRSSFWFSDIGQPDLSGLAFPGSAITGIFHLCQITSPPALGLLSCIYQQQLTLSYNFIAPLLGTQWISELHDIMRDELLDNN